MHIADPLTTVDTMSALATDDLRFIRNNCHITIAKLAQLIESYLQVMCAYYLGVIFIDSDQASSWSGRASRLRVNQSWRGASSSH